MLNRALTLNLKRASSPLNVDQGWIKNHSYVVYRHLLPPFYSLWNMASSIQGWRVLQYNAGAVLAFLHHCVYVFISTGCTVIPGQSGQRSVMDPIVFPVTAALQKWPQSQLFKSQVSKHNEGQQYHLETPPPTHHSKDVVSLTSGRCLNCLVWTPGGLSYQTLHSFGSLKNTLFKMCPIYPSLEHKVLITLQLAIAIWTNDRRFRINFIDPPGGNSWCCSSNG